ADRMEKKGISLDVDLLEKQLHTKIALVSARKKTGIDKLKELIISYGQLPLKPCLNASSIDPEYFDSLQKKFPEESLYKLWLVITQDVNFGKVDRKKTDNEAGFTPKEKSELKRLQQKETIHRYQFINNLLKEALQVDANSATDLRSRLDRVLTHRFWGYVIFFAIMLLIFQAIYNWSAYPMDLIDRFFASLS